MIIRELSSARIQELERVFEKEINDYQNKIICRKKFIYIIKEKCNFLEFCYLYEKFIGKIESVRRIPPNITLEDFNYLIATNDEVNSSYNDLERKKHSNKNPKKLVRIEKMARKKSYYK